MTKKFQVFVSSTYEDLKTERQSVIQAILSIGHMAVGMEFFPAADDDSWKVIQKTIDQCDYYVVIVAGKYGSLSPAGISYTQAEYEYAMQTGVPVIAFLHAEPETLPANAFELDKETRVKLEAFRSLCKEKLCQLWTDSVQLPAQVIASLVKLIEDKPRTGWVRADEVPSEATASQVLVLQEKLQLASDELNRFRAESDSWKSDLAQGNDEFAIQGYFTLAVVKQGRGITYPEHLAEIKLTWDAAFAAIGPFLFASVSFQQIYDRLVTYMKEKESHQFGTNSRIQSFKLSTDDIQTTLLQFQSLEYIERDTSKTSGEEGEVYWRLTHIGSSHLARIKALKRDSTQQ